MVPIPGGDGNACWPLPDPFEVLAVLDVHAEHGASIGPEVDRWVAMRHEARREVEKRSGDELFEAYTVAMDCLLTGRKVRDVVVSLMLLELP
jgi:hypothetical protein